MKFNTKICTPISKSDSGLLIHTNNYIPPNKRDNDQDKKVKPSSEYNNEYTLGRFTKYLPWIILTPTLKSSRLNNDNKDDELETLILNMGKMDMKRDKEEDSEGEEEVELEPNDDSTTALGLIDKAVFSYRTNQEHKVRRSARLSQ
jgi:hypothetical protein